MTKNHLGSQTSPYLRQHADNPVHWMVWGEEAFESAKSQNKPILLSIGYSACHWCHVMAHESFEDPETAEMMNELFVNIKVDREEHPDVDSIYQKTLSLMGQQGGWPLTMFLTPEGQPFWGGTYFPNRKAYGRSSFKEVMQTISRAFHTQKSELQQNIEEIEAALKDNTEPNGDGSLSLELITRTVSFLTKNLDPTYGGLRGSPKFPQPVLFEFLWRTSWNKNNVTLQKLIHLTLEKMCQGGIYDHLGGGFARYSTDEQWLAPHFEKMLYDNALIVSLLCMIYRKHPDLVFKQTIYETITWVLRDMVQNTEHGPLLSSALDADSEGVEGKFYVWDRDEVEKHLSKDSTFFNHAYDVTRDGNWEGKNILRRLTTISSTEEESQLKVLRNKLYEVRQNRIPPGLDHKVLCDWNAMMIKALAEAGLVFDEPGWIERAEEIFQALCKILTRHDQLHHSWCEGQLGSPAYLEDYANLCHAALALYEATGKESYLKQAETWVDHLNSHFWDNEHGGYNFAQEKTVQSLDIHPKPIHDNATPSGNGIMAHVLSELFHLTGNHEYEIHFNQLINTFGSSDPNDIFASPHLCSAFEGHQKMEIIAIIGDLDKNDTKLLINKAVQSPSPYRKLLLADGINSFNPSHPLHGKTQIDEKPTVYICKVGQCSAPINSVDALEDYLSKLPQ